MRGPQEDARVTELLREYDRQVVALVRVQRELADLGVDVSRVRSTLVSVPDVERSIFRLADTLAAQQPGCAS